MNPASHNDNTKKVLRIALVGIRPADQIILKGYLRLLMRLEADLEWVSANHDAVDLFMVNSEFQHAESVQRLLTIHPYSAVIYISRTESDDGFLLGNILTLPIKDLDPLNQWLYANLRMLAGKSAPKTTNQTNTTQKTQTTNQTTTTPKRQSLDDLIASRQNQPFQVPTSTPTLNTGVNVNAIQADKTIATAFAKIIARLNKKEDLLLSVNDKNGTFLAYIQPKQQRIWQLAPLTQAGEWTLNVANPTALEMKDSEDLVQFLWQFGLNNSQFFESFINPTNQYRITSFVKPDSNEQRNRVLKVQCVLEARLATLPEIAQLADIDNEEAQKILIALILSGVMTSDVYENLIQTINDFSKNAPETVSIGNIIPEPIPMPSRQSTTHLQQEIQKEQPQSAQKEQNNGMKGFLSRLRSKLGI